MPPERHGSANTPSRPRAALLCLRPSPVALGAILAMLLLTGCASGGASPMGEIFRDAWGGSDGATDRAAEITFASLVLNADDRSGLVVLGALAEPESFWPTGNRGLVTLRHGGLHATAGLTADLLDTRYTVSEGEAEVPWRLSAPADFSVTRTWQRGDGLTEQMSAEGSLACAAAEPYALPLATLTLEPCAMTLVWENGRTTRGELWRDPQTLRLWAAEEQAWPDGPRMSWEVARQWW